MFMCGGVAYGICSESEVKKSGVEIVREVDPTLHFSKVKYYRRTIEHQTAPLDLKNL